MANNSTSELFLFCGYQVSYKKDYIISDLYLPFYSMFYCFKWGYRVFILPIIILNGLFGNLISIQIFLKRTDYNSTCRIYYLIMSFSDLIYFVVFGIPEWTGEGWLYISADKFSFSPENLNEYSCRIFRYQYHVSWFISVWILAVYSTERLLAIYFPFMRMNVISLTKAKWLSFIVVMLGALIYSYILFTDVFQIIMVPNNFCYFGNEERFLNLFHLFFTLIVIALGPPFILLINNLLLLAKLKNIAESRTSITRASGNISSVEIQAAKDLVVLSFITIGLSTPLMVWPAVLVMECML